jgi:hypothetical protein
LRELLAGLGGLVEIKNTEDLLVLYQIQLVHVYKHLLVPTYIDEAQVKQA